MSLNPIEKVLEASGDASSTLTKLTQIIMRREGKLSTFEKELIAAWISHSNGATFCCNSHSQIALSLKPEVVDRERLTSLLNLADLFRLGHYRGEYSNTFSLEEEKEVAFVVGLFMMFNSLINSLTRDMTMSEEEYIKLGNHIATNGYE